MNSKMTALVAILAVGVLAAAGLGYAWSAQYISNDNELNGQFVLIQDLNDGNDTAPANILAEYSTIKDKSVNEYGTVYTTTDAAIEIHLQGTTEGLEQGKTYTLTLNNGSVINLSDGSKITYNNSAWTWSAAAADGVITAWAVPTITITGLTIDCTTAVVEDVDITISLPILAVEVNAQTGAISAGSAIVSTGAANLEPGAAYLDSVNLTFTIAESA